MPVERTIVQAGDVVVRSVPLAPSLGSASTPVLSPPAWPCVSLLPLCRKPLSPFPSRQ